MELRVVPLGEELREAAAAALDLPPGGRIRFQGESLDPAEMPGVVASLGDKVVGASLFTVQSDRLIFLRTVVAGRNRALLRCLFACAERQGRHLGCRTARLYICSPSPELVEMYQQLGYRICALYPAVVAGHLGAEHGRDVFELEKPLLRARSPA